MKILFMGSHQPGISALDELMATGEHDLFVVSPPAEQMRHWHKSVHDWAVERGLPAARPEDVNADAFYKVASAFGPDLILSVFYNQILERRILNLPRLGPLNVHPSLLPEYRGTGVLIWAIIDGASEVGITIHLMEERVDAGDIVLQRAISVGQDDTGFGLYQRVADLIREVFHDEFLDMLRKEHFPRRPMPHLTEPFSSRTPQRNHIDWTQPAHTIADIVRALTFPLDGAFTEYERERLYVWRAVVADGVRTPDGPPGAMATYKDSTRLVARAGDNRAVELLEVGYAGQQLGAREFIARHWQQPAGLAAPDRFTYRPWREGDDPACVDMIAPLGWMTAERYARKFEDDGLVPGSVLIAECGGEICGHSITALRRLIFGDARLRTATIGQVVVREDLRGRGVGRRLLEQALRFARTHGAELVWLTAHPDRGAAYDMYRRRGFEQVQHRLIARFSANESTNGLSARQASRSDAAELMRLRRAFARRTGAVQDRDYEQALGWKWWLVSRGPRAHAAVRIRMDGETPTISTVLFDVDEDPAPYMNSAVRSAGLSDVDVHASPASPLVARMPGLDWQTISGENLAFVPSLSRLFRSLLPFYRRRAIELGIRTGRVTVERNDVQIALAFDGGEARILPPLPDDTCIVFPSEGIVPAVLGALDRDAAMRDGTISVRDGPMPGPEALAWLFPHQYCDFTQHSAW